MALRLFGVAAPILLLAACSGGQTETKGGPGGPGARGPAEVGFVVVQPTGVAQLAELAGRTSAFQMSEVRPQVTGLIRRRLFREGALVRQGQPLFQIDPSLYRAATSQADANLASARANAEAAQIRASRYKPLADIEAVSKQEYTDALATSRQASASVAQNRAALETARINLRFTTVPAPITGRIGRSLFTEGALVSATQADPLAVIQRLDPIFVDIQQASGELLALRKALANGGATAASARVRLKLEDGSDYGATGVVEFAEAMVDPATGTVTLRARFPNPQGLLLPGMFVRATFAQGIDQNAFLIPQQAITRDAKGNASLFILGPGNKAVPRTVKTARTEGAFWVVTEGLRPGERVITQGLGKVQPNAVVKPVPAAQAQRIAPPPQGQGKPAGAQGKGG
ncbi:MAG: efflux RND transporter periplasmic adaptor subunit [Pseudomonadota bacterium]